MRGWIRLAILGIGCAAIGTLRAQDSVSSQTVAAIPFELSSGFLVVVEGQVGDVGGLKFIVDTGATRSVIDRNVVAKLHLRRHTAKIMNFDRFSATEYADVPTIQMGPLRARGLRVIVANLLEYSEFATGVDGIVGADLLSRSRMLGIDYEKKRLHFELEPNEPIPGPAPRCFVVPVVVQGATMRLVVDTGLAEILLYGDRLEKYGSRIRTEGQPETVSIGRIHGRKVALSGVQLGRSDETITAILIDGPAERTMLALDGYLGVASLHAKRVDFDFAKMTLRWQ